MYHELYCTVLYCNVLYLEHDLDELRLVILSKLPQDQLADVLEIYHALLLHLTRKMGIVESAC